MIKQKHYERDQQPTWAFGVPAAHVADRISLPEMLCLRLLCRTMATAAFARNTRGGLPFIYSLSIFLKYLTGMYVVTPVSTSVLG